MIIVGLTQLHGFSNKFREIIVGFTVPTPVLSSLSLRVIGVVWSALAREAIHRNSIQFFGGRFTGRSRPRPHGFSNYLKVRVTK